MSYSVSTLLLRNLADVFGQIDPLRRRAAIDELFSKTLCSTTRAVGLTAAATRSTASRA